MGRRPNIEKLEKKRDLPRLVAALESDDGVAAAATAALGRFGSSDATAAVLGASKHGCPEVRIEALRALGRTGGTRAVDRLAEMAKADPDEPVQLEAIAALRHVGSRDTVDALADVATTAPDGSAAKAAARQAVLDLGPAVLPHVVTRLDGERDQATAAALLLGRVGDPAAVDALMHAMHGGRADPDACLAALSTIGSEAAIDALIELLDDEHLSPAAATALGRHVSLPRVTEALVKTVSAPSDTTRGAAIAALATAGNGGVVTALRGALDDPAVSVRQEAAAVLIRRGYRSADIVDTLIDQIRIDTAWPGMTRAAELLGLAGDVRALDPLNRMLDKYDDVDFNARDAARIAIRRIKDPAGNGRI
jgi:HEAT repeat protein